MQRFLKSLIILLTSNVVITTSQAAPDWVDDTRDETNAYFLHALNPRVEIYDLQNQSWKTPITLSQTPSALHVDDTYLYIAYGKVLYRYLKNGSGETHMANLSNNVKALQTDGNLLFVDYSNSSVSVDSYNRSTLAKIDTFTTTDYRWAHTFEINPETDTLFAQDYNGRYVPLSYTSTGLLADSVSYTSFSSYTNGRIYQWPSSQRIIARSGSVYKTPSLKTIANLEYNFELLEFAKQTLPIITIGNDVISYSRSYQETGRVTLEETPESIFIHHDSESVFAFYPSDESDNGMSVEIISYEALSIDDPDAPINPATLAFTPEDKIVDQNGILYLSHDSFEMLFRWDSATQAWLENLPLKSSPQAIAFAPNQNRLYLGYLTGEINYFDTTVEQPTETLFKNVGEPIGLIVETGAFLFVDQYDGSSQTFHIYNTSGTEMASQTHGSRDQNAVWNESTRRIVYTSPGYYSRVHSGGVGSDGKLSDYTFSHIGLVGQQAPLYSHPSQGLVLTTNGHILKTDVRESVSTLPNPIVGATWIDGRLHTAQDGGIKSWDLPTYAENGNKFTFEQQPIGLVGTPDDHLLLLTQAISGQIRIKKLDTSYNIIAPSTLATPTLKLDKRVATAARLEWSYVSGAASYTVERSEDNGKTWEPLPEITNAETTTHIENDLALNSEYLYRVKAKNGDLASNYSNSIIVDTTITPSDLVPLEIEDINGELNWADTDDSGILYMNFWNTDAIFRYDLNQQEWLESLPLTNTAGAIHLSKSRNAILTGYDDGMVNYISLSGNVHSEIPFTKLNDSVRFISSNSEYFVLSEYNNQYVYDNVGGEMSSKYILYPDSFEAFWWDEISKQFYWKDSYLYAAVIDENQQLQNKGAIVEAYYNGNLIAENFAASLLLASDGSIFSVNTGGRLLDLEQNISSGVWVAGNLFVSYNQKIQKLNATTYAEDSSKTIENYIARILKGPGDTIATISTGYRPAIELLKTDLSVSPPDVLATPSKPVSFDPTGSGASLYWQDIGGENAYVIERRASGGNWVELVELPANRNSYEDSTASTDKTYDYRVKAINGELESSYSEIFTITNLEPSAAGNPQAEITETNQVKLSWNGAANAYGYAIMRSTDGSYWNRQGTVDANRLEWTDNNYFYQGTLYYYRIDTLGSYGRIASSEIVTAGINYGLPSKPNLYVNYQDFTSIRVTSNRGSNTESIRIERTLDEDPKDWVEVASLKLGTSEFTDTGLPHSTRFLYRAIGINANGESIPSNVAITATNTLLPPDEPSIMIGQTENNHVQIFCITEESTETIYIYRRGFLENEPQLISQLTEERFYIDENVEISKGYTYYAIAGNEVGKSAQSHPWKITIVESHTLLEEDFENEIPTDKFSTLDGIIQSETDNRFYSAGQSYRTTIIPKKELSNGGNIAFSIKYISEQSYGYGTVRVSITPKESQSYNLYYIITSSLVEPDEWNRFYLNIPRELITDDAQVRIILESNVYGSTSPLRFDDLVITEFPIQPPAKPTAVVAKETTQGDTAVFWLPSPESDYYLVESSVDEGSSWAEIAQVNSPTSFFHDMGYLSVPVQYRISAVNKGGQSEPTYSEKVQGDYDLTLATSAGVEKVLNSPIAYFLYTAEELETARIEGQSDVKSDPSKFGLFREVMISHLYYRVTNEWIALKGGLPSVTWSLYRSSNLKDWTKFTTDFSFELEPEPEAEPAFIKITPNIERVENEDEN